MYIRKIYQASATALCAMFLVSGFVANNALASGQLVVYCSATNDLCEGMTTAFQKKTGIEASFVRDSSGSTLTKIQEQQANPQADVWYGGTLDPQAHAAELGLLEPYRSNQIDNVIEKFRDPAKTKGNYTSAIYIGILGYGVNTQRLKTLGIDTVPKCWSDLKDPRLKGEIQIADPQSSGTAYTAIATFIQLWGEDQAFDYLKALDQNISEYTKSGITGPTNAARGETTIGIGFLHDFSLLKMAGAPIDMVVPCEGTGYELGGVAIIKNAQNLENAKLFVDFVLSKEGQETAWKRGNSHQTLTNLRAEQSPTAFELEALNLIDYDFEKYGQSTERDCLIKKWVSEIKQKN